MHQKGGMREGELGKLCTSPAAISWFSLVLGRMGKFPHFAFFFCAAGAVDRMTRCAYVRRFLSRLVFVAGLISTSGSSGLVGSLCSRKLVSNRRAFVRRWRSWCPVQALSSFGSMSSGIRSRRNWFVVSTTKFFNSSNSSVESLKRGGAAVDGTDSIGGEADGAELAP